MKSVAFILVLVTVILWMIMLAPARALVNCDVPDDEAALDYEELSFLILLNQYRAENGRGALVANENLNRAAAYHSRDMIARVYFAHTSPDGRDAFQRMRDCGMAGNGENLAGGFSSAQSVLDAWKASPGHNAGMLNASFKQIGIGRVSGGMYGWVWTTDFSSAVALTPSPAPTGTGTQVPTPTATASPTRTPRPTATPIPDPNSLGWCRRPSLLICVVGIYATKDGQQLD